MNYKLGFKIFAAYCLVFCLTPVAIGFLYGLGFIPSTLQEQFFNFLSGICQAKCTSERNSGKNKKDGFTDVDSSNPSNAAKRINVAKNP